MFAVPERDRLRDQLIARAQQDPAVSAAALVGSMATGREDRWSDIDLALEVDQDAEAALADWTACLYDQHGALHHLDIWADGTLYRAFLLKGTLQVDLSFWSPGRLLPRGPSFRLLFGEANDPAPSSLPRPVT